MIVCLYLHSGTLTNKVIAVKPPSCAVKNIAIIAIIANCFSVILYQGMWGLLAVDEVFFGHPYGGSEPPPPMLEYMTCSGWTNTLLRGHASPSVQGACSQR